MKLWKRNAVVAAIVVFVGCAVYLNWSYGQKNTPDSADTGKILGQAALVGGTADPLLSASASPAPGESASPAPTDAAAPESGTPTYFDNARLNRQQARDSALSLLREAAADENAMAETIESANQSIQAMADYTLCEANIENLVVAKGYADCLAFRGEDSASVVVSKPGGVLDDTDVAKISQIVMEETGLELSKIKIVPVE